MTEILDLDLWEENPPIKEELTNLILKKLKVNHHVLQMIPWRPFLILICEKYIMLKCFCNNKKNYYFVQDVDRNKSKRKECNRFSFLAFSNILISVIQVITSTTAKNSTYYQQQYQETK